MAWINHPACGLPEQTGRQARTHKEEDQAEILSKGQADLYERLVTKEYFEFTLTHELEKLRAELKGDIAKVQANLKITRTELKRYIEELKRDIKEMEQKLTIKLGALLVIGVTVMTVLDKLLQAPCRLDIPASGNDHIPGPPARPLVPDATPRLG